MAGIISLLLCGVAAAQGTANPAADCGLSPAYVASCGNVGTVADPGAGTDMNAAGLPYTITASGIYKLTANGGSDATACQVTLTANIDSGAVTIYLGGFTLTGRICVTGRVLNGLRVTYGTVNCTHADSGSNAGCVRAEITSGAQAVKYQVDHLTVLNSADSAAGGVRGIHVLMQPASWSGSGAALEIYNNTVSLAADTDALRVRAIEATGGNVASGASTYGGAYIYRNRTIGHASANAQQGIEVYGIRNSRVYRNHVTIPNNAMSSQGRGILLDCDGCVVATYGDDGQIYENYVDADNNRAIRLRSVQNVKVYGNFIDNVRDTGFGAFHDGDQTSTADIATNNRYYRNIIYIRDGNGFWGRGMTATHVYDNDFRCHASGCGTGRALYVRTIAGSMTTSTLTAWQNLVSASIGAGVANGCSNTAGRHCVETGGVLNVCNSGTAIGPGTITASTCP